MDKLLGMNQKQIEVNSYGIIPFFVKDNKIFYLAIQHNGGHIDFPKGRKNYSTETDLDCAKREFSEETGLNALKIKILSDETFVNNYKYKKKGNFYVKKVTFYLGEYNSEVKSEDVNIQTSEIRDFILGDFDLVYSKLSFSMSKELLSKANFKLMNNTKI